MMDKQKLCVADEQAAKLAKEIAIKAMEMALENINQNWNVLIENKTVMNPLITGAGCVRDLLGDEHG